jgi:type III pantothenate kinase
MVEFFDKKRYNIKTTIRIGGRSVIFAIDVGNTNIVIGCYRDGELAFVSRIATNVSKMQDQYAVEFANILSLYHCGTDCFEGAIISSVVPPLTPVLRDALKHLLGCRVFVVSPELRHDLVIKIKQPSILGSDLIAASVAAKCQFPMPCIIIDLGTATKIMALDRDGAFLGCSIMPGVNISLEALSARTAQLPQINLESVAEIIGTTSIDSMKSGIVYGTASMVEGMIQRYASVLGDDVSVVATGGLSSVIIPFCRDKIAVNRNLVLDGLYQIYRMNNGE